MREESPNEYVHSVRIELAKLILVGTRMTYQATGDVYIYIYYLSGMLVRETNLAYQVHTRYIVHVHMRKRCSRRCLQRS